MNIKVILLIPVLLMGCTHDTPITNSTVQQNTNVTQGTDLQTEEYAVYSTVLNKFYEDYNSKYVELMVIRDRTAQEGPSGETLDKRLTWISKELDGEVEQETLEDFKDKNRQPIMLNNHFDIKVKYVLVSEEEIHSLFQKGKGWDTFFEKYPKSPGIIELSRIGFNREMNQALVYFGGPSAGSYMLLVKKDGAWSLKREVGAWVS